VALLQLCIYQSIKQFQALFVNATGTHFLVSDIALSLVKTNLMQGVIHLVLFAIFLFLTPVP